MKQGLPRLPNCLWQGPSRCLTALLLIGPCGHASASPQKHSPFEDIPRNHWTYTALHKMVKAGIVRYPTSCFPSSRGYKYDAEHRTLTRYEFAVALQRAQALLKARQPSAHEKQTTQQIALQHAMNKLTLEFRQELAQLNGR